MSIETVSIPELCPANENKHIFAIHKKGETDRIHQTIGRYHLITSLQKYLA